MPDAPTAEELREGALCDPEVAFAVDMAIAQHGSLRAAARALGTESGLLSRIRRGLRPVPENLLAPLNLEHVSYYIWKGEQA